MDAIINRDTVRRYSPRLLLPLLGRLQRSALASRLAYGMAWSVLGAVASRGLALCASIVAARVLGRSAFGELGIIQSTTNMYATFAQIGGLTATKHVAEFKTTAPRRAGHIVALSFAVAVASGSVIGVFMLITAGWAASVVAAPWLSTAIAASALVALLIVINEALDGVLSGLEAFKRRSQVQVMAGIAAFPLMVLGVVTFGLIGAVWGLIASQLMLALLNCHAIVREACAAGVPLHWRGLMQEADVLTKFSLPTVVSGAVYVPAMWLANTILVNGPGGYAEMGIFNAADRWRTAILFLPSLLGSVTLPMLSSLRSEAELGRYHRLLWTNMKVSAVASGAIAVPIALLAPWIMAGYGPDFRQGAVVLVMLSATSVAFAAYWIVGQSLVSRGDVWTLFLFNLAWAITLISAAWGLRNHGAQGLAGAYLVADSGRLVAALIYATRTRTAERRTQEEKSSAPA